MKSLAGRAALGCTAVVACIGAAIFLPAWTVDYWQAWSFLAVYAVCSALAVGYLWKHDRALLERRMSGGPFAETAPTQKVIMFLASVGFVGILVIAGFDHRQHWSNAPAAIAILGDSLVAIGFCIAVLVFRANSFAAATIGVASGQRVISTGPYAVVRHPMYAGGAVLIAGIPLALGSYWGLAVFVEIVPVLIWRLLDEEAFLTKNLPGYTEYASKVRRRLLPGVF